MAKFKIGDRVIVPEGARMAYGDPAVRTGPGVITLTEDQEGDVRVRFDGGGGYGCYVLASDVKREKVFVQPGDVSVGDKVRVRVTSVTGSKFKYEFVVTNTGHSTLYFAEGSVPYERAGTARTFEILEKAALPEPEPEPLKVGDTVEGVDQYASLPVGAVVSAGTASALVHTSHGWINSRHGGAEDPYLQRTIVWLPEVSN